MEFVLDWDRKWIVTPDDRSIIDVSDLTKEEAEWVCNTLNAAPTNPWE